LDEPALTLDIHWIGICWGREKKKSSWFTFLFLSDPMMSLSH